MPAPTVALAGRDDGLWELQPVREVLVESTGVRDPRHLRQLGPLAQAGGLHGHPPNVVARTEVGSLAGEDDDLHVVIGGGLREAGGEELCMSGERIALRRPAG